MDNKLKRTINSFLFYSYYESANFLRKAGLEDTPSAFLTTNEKKELDGIHSVEELIKEYVASGKIYSNNIFLSKCYSSKFDVKLLIVDYQNLPVDNIFSSECGEIIEVEKKILGIFPKKVAKKIYKLSESVSEVVEALNETLNKIGCSQIEFSIGVHPKDDYLKRRPLEFYPLNVDNYTSKGELGGLQSCLCVKAYYPKSSRDAYFDKIVKIIDEE